MGIKYLFIILLLISPTALIYEKKIIRKEWVFITFFWLLIIYVKPISFNCFCPRSNKSRFFLNDFFISPLTFLNFIFAIKLSLIPYTWRLD